MSTTPKCAECGFPLHKGAPYIREVFTGQSLLIHEGCWDKFFEKHKASLQTSNPQETK